jgi:putative phosphoesterase
VKLGIISDTHGDVAGWRQALAGPFQAVDLILHAGDILYHGPRNPMVAGYAPPILAEAINASPVPIIFARGNCDSPVDQLVLDYPIQAPYARVQIGAVGIWLQHGDELSREQMVEQARRYRVQVGIFGHTHIPELELREGILLFNPGSPSLPKAGVLTVGLLDTEKREACLIELATNKVLGQVQF